MPLVCKPEDTFLLLAVEECYEFEKKSVTEGIIGYNEQNKPDSNVECVERSINLAQSLSCRIQPITFIDMLW